jgi:hypothetical protein
VHYVLKKYLNEKENLMTNKKSSNKSTTLVPTKHDVLELTNYGDLSVVYFHEIDEDAPTVAVIETPENPTYEQVRSLVWYGVLRSDAPDVINTVPWTTTHLWQEGLCIDSDELADAQEIDKDKVVQFSSWDHAILRPFEKRPGPQVIMLSDSAAGISAYDFNIAIAQDILRAHPWVTYLVKEDERKYSDSTTPAALNVGIRIPDDLWNKAFDAWQATYPFDEPIDIEQNRPPMPNWWDLIVKPAIYSKTDLPDPAKVFGRDPLGLTPALKRIK